MYLNDILTYPNHILKYPIISLISCNIPSYSNVFSGIIERLTGKVNTVAPPLTSVMDDIPRELPVELWSGCLQSLFLQSNKIKFLPDYIGGFTGLARLDISGYASVCM